jgi:hypothetical protein
VESQAIGLERLESIEVEGAEGMAADEDGVAAYAPAEEDGHVKEPPQVDDGLPNDWSLVHDEGSNQEFWWSEARQESKWADESVEVPTDHEEHEEYEEHGEYEEHKEHEEYEEHEEHEEYGQEHEEHEEYGQEHEETDIIYEQEEGQELERVSSSLSKPVLDFDDLSDDHFDLDGELPQTDELHVYDSADEAAKAEEEAPKDESIDDWKLIVDEDSGRDYWWSDSRNEAQWVDEEGKVAVGETSKDGFELHEDEEGHQYLFNPETGESEWL